MRIVTLLACLACVAFQAVPSLAQESTDCDRLTTQEALPAGADANAAVAACEAAMAAQPGEPRIVYQYALALERAGRIEDAMRMYQWAADDGYSPAVEAVARLTSAGPVDAWSEAERVALGESLAGISAAMRRFQNELPSDPSDPLTIIGEIGTDPAMITQWVATNTRLIPYAGSLRGPRGVLSDRRGNSLDRALTLAALLSAAGEDVRLARATLDDRKADALLVALSNPAAPLPPVQASSRTPQEAADLLAESGELPADMAKAIIDHVSDRNQQIETAVAEQSAVLIPLLLEATEEMQAVAATQQRLRDQEALREHYWVQVQRGAIWTDYDPEVSVIGPLTAVETMDIDTMPDTLRHAVTVRVIVEIQSAAGRQEEVLVSWTGSPASLGQTLVSLGHVADSSHAVKQLVEGRAHSAQVLTAIDGTTSWMPVLLVAGTVIADKLFTSDGAVRAVDPNVFTQGGRAALNVFGEAGELLGADEIAEASAGVPVAEWIEVEVSVPGAASRVERRAIFDLLGPSARAAGETLSPTPDQLRLRVLRLAGTTDMLILGATPSAIELKRSGSDGIIETLENLRTLVQGAGTPSIDDIPPEPRLALSLRQFARSRLLHGLLAISSPNVFMHHQRLVWDPLAGVGWQEQIDIVFNDAAAPSEGFAARLRQGVLDTVLEGAIAESGPEGNTAVAMLEDIGSGEDWVLLRRHDDRELSTYAPDLRTRIEADLARGYYALAPTDGTSAGAWWRIDPISGAALGMTPAGGAAMAEYTLLFAQGIASGLCFAGLGTGVVAIMGGGGVGNLVAGAAFCAAAGGFGAVGVGLGGAFAGVAEAGAAGALTVGVMSAGAAAGGLVLGF
jgi:hypothetical protein